MGTGKSKVLVDNIAMLYDRGAIRGALIIAPKGVYKNWDQIEFPVHMPDHVEHKKVLWEANITKKKQMELDTLFDDKEELKKLEVKYDLLFKELKSKLVEKLYSIVSGKTCQGINNDLGEEILPKGKKYSLKLIN